MAKAEAEAEAGGMGRCEGERLRGQNGKEIVVVASGGG